MDYVYLWRISVLSSSNSVKIRGGVSELKGMKGSEVVAVV